MTTCSDRTRQFPLPLTVRGKALVFRPISPSCRDAMLAFAGNLSKQDLLFLDRDIAQTSVVDQWIRDAVEGDLFTVVAWEGETIVGYATVDRGSASWTRHVAELRVVVGEACRGIGVGRWLLEVVFEIALEAGATKLIARMTPDQTGAMRLFQHLGFEQEAILRDHALDAKGLTHDLLVLGYHTRRHLENRCRVCGIPVLASFSLDGVRLCSHCFESRYDELGGGG